MSDRIEKLLYKLIGERVRARRGSLTQTQLAERVGLGRTSITNLESGTQRMPLHYLVRIAQSLDCDVRALIPSREELQEGGTKVILGVTETVGAETQLFINQHLTEKAVAP